MKARKPIITGVIILFVLVILHIFPIYRHIILQQTINQYHEVLGAHFFENQENLDALALEFSGKDLVLSTSVGELIESNRIGSERTKYNSDKYQQGINIIVHEFLVSKPPYVKSIWCYDDIIAFFYNVNVKSSGIYVCLVYSPDSNVHEFIPVRSERILWLTDDWYIAYIFSN